MRKPIGYFLISVTLIIILRWVYAVIQAQQLVGSPFLWVLTPLLLFVGFYLVAKLPAGSVGKATQRAIRRRLILIYMVFAGLIGLGFLIVHVLNPATPTPGSRVYVPVAILVAIVGYAPFYLVWVRKGGYVGRSNILIPFFFVLGITFSPIAIIEIYNANSGELEVIASGNELPDAKSNLFKLQNINVATAYLQEWTNHTLKHNKLDADDHRLDYWGLVPVATGRQDTLFTYWIDVHYFEHFDGDQPDETLRAQEQVFIAACHDRLSRFSADSIIFFDRSKQDASKVLRYNKYPLASESVVMKPIYESLEDYRQGESLTYLILLGLVTLFFWGIAALNDD